MAQLAVYRTKVKENSELGNIESSEKVDCLQNTEKAEAKEHNKLHLKRLRKKVMKTANKLHEASKCKSDDKLVAWPGDERMFYWRLLDYKEQVVC